MGAQITFISHTDGLYISPSTHPFYCSAVSPSLCGEISTQRTLENFPTTTVLLSPKPSASRLPPYTSLKHRSLAVLHGSESLCIESLMGQCWLTFRLIPLLMNSGSHHHCIPSPLKPALCWRGLEMRSERTVDRWMERKKKTGIELDSENSRIVTCEAALSRFRQSSEKDLPKR